MFFYILLMISTTVFVKQQSMFEQHAKTTKYVFPKNDFYANLMEELELNIFFL